MSRLQGGGGKREREKERERLKCAGSPESGGWKVA